MEDEMGNLRIIESVTPPSTLRVTLKDRCGTHKRVLVMAFPTVSLPGPARVLDN